MAPIAGAQSVISWNYDNNGTVTGADVAGIAPAANWNNSWPSNPLVDLMDDTGAATTLDLSYQSFNSYSIQGSHPGADLDGTYNKELLNGYLNSGPASWGPPTTTSSVTLTQIPFTLYTVIVYFSADVAGRAGDVINNSTTYSFNTLGSASISGSNALFVQTTDTGGLYTTAANYAVFSNLSGTSQTFTVAMRDNDQWGGIAGFQVVAVPEPSTLSLAVGVGLLAIVRLRRQRRLN
jgi:hypothetical protein